MLQPKVTSLPGHIQAVYVQNIAKLYAKILASEEEVCLSYDADTLKLKVPSWESFNFKQRPAS